MLEGEVASEYSEYTVLRSLRTLVRLATHQYVNLILMLDNMIEGPSTPICKSTCRKKTCSSLSSEAQEAEAPLQLSCHWLKEAQTKETAP
jgi:hypothetical protein